MYLFALLLLNWRGKHISYDVVPQKYSDKQFIVAQWALRYISIDKWLTEGP